MGGNIRKSIATRKNMEIYHVNKNENQKKIKEIELFMVKLSTRKDTPAKFFLELLY